MHGVETWLCYPSWCWYESIIIYMPQSYHKTDMFAYHARIFPNVHHFYAFCPLLGWTESLFGDKNDNDPGKNVNVCGRINYRTRNIMKMLNDNMALLIDNQYAKKTFVMKMIRFSCRHYWNLQNKVWRHNRCESRGMYFSHDLQKVQKNNKCYSCLSCFIVKGLHYTRMTLMILDM